MKKLALLCAAAVCLAACHCERRTTGTPCRKAVCQASAVNSKAQKADEARKAEAEKKAAEEAAALSTVGNTTRQGNVIALKFKEPIRFAYNSDQIAASSNKNLEATANVLKKYPNNKITVKGYTDSLGDPAYNVDLSQRRAKAVADALVARGVNAANINAIGYGAAYPVADNKTSAGRAQNRRVELQIEVK